MTAAETAALKAKLAKEKPTLGEFTGIHLVEHAPRKLDIACGQRKEPGFKGMDLSGDADIQHDLFSYPWPIKDRSVSEMRCQHFVEHIPHGQSLAAMLPILQVATDFEDFRRRMIAAIWVQEGWFRFFQEIHRIGRKGATVEIVHPYANSNRADQDPTHTRRINETTWYYLSKEWRLLQLLDHYDTDVDFDIISIDGIGVPEDVMLWNDERQALARARNINMVGDLKVTMKVRK